MSDGPAIKSLNVTRSFTIAFTLRSGSNEICKLLSQNGLGFPGELFQQGKTFEEFCAIVEESQANGIFGSKMSHDHRAALDEQLRKHVAAYRTLDDVLPNHRWVWLKRRDRILQAISWCRAEQSNEWAKTAEGAANVAMDFNYDFFHLLSRVIMISSNEFAWEVYFNKEKIQPFVVIYEDFFADVPNQLRALIEHLGGLNAGRQTIDSELTFQVQRSEKSYALRQRFVSDLSKMGERRLAKQIGEPLQRWNSFFFNFGWRGSTDPRSSQL